MDSRKLQVGSEGGNRIAGLWRVRCFSDTSSEEISGFTSEMIALLANKGSLEFAFNYRLMRYGKQVFMLLEK